MLATRFLARRLGQIYGQPLFTSSARTQFGKYIHQSSWSSFPSTQPCRRFSVARLALEKKEESMVKKDIETINKAKPFNRTSTSELEDLAAEDLADVSRSTYVRRTDLDIAETEPKSFIERFRRSEVRAYKGESDQDGYITPIIIAILGVSIALSYLLRVLTFKENSSKNGELSLPFSNKEIFIYVGGPTRAGSELMDGISQKYKITILNIYDILEKERNSSTSRFGPILRHCANEKIRIPSEILLAIISAHLEAIRDDVVVIEGFPRTLSQLVMMEKEICTVDGFISETGLDTLNEHELIKKLQKEGTFNNLTNESKNNQLERLRHQLKIFYEETVPLLKSYKQKGNLISINTDAALNTNSRVSSDDGLSDVSSIIQAMKSSIQHPPRPKNLTPYIDNPIVERIDTSKHFI